MLLFIASLQNTGGATNLTPGVGTLAITGFAPTVAQTANQALTPSAGTLTLTGFAPTVAQPQAVTPDVGALTLTGFTPALDQTANQSLTPTQGALTFTGFAPSLAQTANQSLLPAEGTLTLTGFAPTLAQPQAVTPSVGALAVTGYAPTLAQSANQTLTPNAGALTLTGFAPTVTVAAAAGSDTKNPTTATQTGAPWSFLSNILACDLALAAVALYPPTGTITTGSFGLSAAGPITGYKIEISCYATNNSGGAGNTAYLRPSLKLGGNSYFPAVTPTLTTFPTGTALSNPTQLQTVSWGGATATWYNESTGTPATFSSSDLAGAQIVLLFDENPGGNDDPTSAYIDCVRLTVYYAAAANATPGAGLLTVTGYAPNVAQTSGETKVGGDDVPRAEIWTTRKAKAVRKRIARKLVELKAAAPDLVEGLAVPALQPDWSAYVAQLQAVAAQLEVLQARRWDEWLEEDDEDILLLL
jgi:hypothetical protein